MFFWFCILFLFWCHPPCFFGGTDLYLVVLYFLETFTISLMFVIRFNALLIIVYGLCIPYFLKLRIAQSVLGRFKCQRLG
ncbi:hypothetical protein L2E82_01685 [Cichorium intybus]|uniref:Uncharacterized protein n=1 Tax=Cichorium intybus TaxID=13427 RepID=A0ACB9GZ83_CICIN|nr:hypothetical protein L2E82_01685 [Cichorium intybus]